MDSTVSGHALCLTLLRPTNAICLIQDGFRCFCSFGLILIGIALSGFVSWVVHKSCRLVSLSLQVTVDRVVVVSGL